MIFESTDPLSSRERFKSRTVLNLIVVASIFVCAVSVMSAVASIVAPGAFSLMFLGDCLALAGAWYFYIIWDRRPIRLRCPNCGKIVLSNTPWVCGVCKEPNKNANDFPFVDKCGHCGGEPKTYKCHHCGEPIFLSEDEDTTSYAHCLNSPSDVPPQARRAEKVKSNQETLEDQDHEIAVAQRAIMKAQLDQRLKIIKQRSEIKEKKPALDAKRESLSEHLDSVMAVEEAARQQKVANAETCQSDKKSLRRMNTAVDDWVQRQMAGDE